MTLEEAAKAYKSLVKHKRRLNLPPNQIPLLLSTRTKPKQYTVLLWDTLRTSIQEIFDGYEILKTYGE